MAIEGPSGSGKTRILRAIADLDPVEAQIFLDGAEWRETPPEVWRRKVRYAAAEPGWWADTPRGTFAPVHLSQPRIARLLSATGR